jgi:hypothetical protein
MFTATLTAALALSLKSLIPLARLCASRPEANQREPDRHSTL